MNRKTLATLALLAFAPLAHAAGSVSCKVDKMTDDRHCATDSVRDGFDGFIVGTTNDQGRELSVMVNIRTFIDRPNVDGLVVRVDGAPAFYVKSGFALSPDVDCHRSRCRWDGTFVARLTAAQWDRIQNGSKVLLALSDSGSVSDPITVDPSVFRTWRADFAAEGIRP